VLRIYAGYPTVATPCSGPLAISSLEGEGCRGKNLLQIRAATRLALEGIVFFPYTLKDLRDLSAGPTTIFIDRHYRLLRLS
jgi:hypothetical protein